MKGFMKPSLPVLLALFSVSADAIPVSIILKDITMHQSTEERGDELYFNITTYGADRNYDHFQVPSHPVHWFSDHLEGVQNVTLWEKDMPDKTSFEVIISLTERDMPPWNIDDLLGSVKVKLLNDDDNVESKWGLYVDRGTTVLLDEDQDLYQYKMSGDGGEYTVTFELRTDQ